MSHSFNNLIFLSASSISDRHEAIPETINSDHRLELHKRTFITLSIRNVIAILSPLLHQTWRLSFSPGRVIADCGRPNANIKRCPLSTHPGGTSLSGAACYALWRQYSLNCPDAVQPLFEFLTAMYTTDNDNCYRFCHIIAIRADVFHCFWDGWQRWPYTVAFSRLVVKKHWEILKEHLKWRKI